MPISKPCHLSCTVQLLQICHLAAKSFQAMKNNSCNMSSQKKITQKKCVCNKVTSSLAHKASKQKTDQREHSDASSS